MVKSNTPVKSLTNTPVNLSTVKPPEEGGLFMLLWFVVILGWTMVLVNDSYLPEEQIIRGMANQRPETYYDEETNTVEIKEGSDWTANSAQPSNSMPGPVKAEDGGLVPVFDDGLDDEIKIIEANNVADVLECSVFQMCGTSVPLKGKIRPFIPIFDESSLLEKLNPTVTFDAEAEVDFSYESLAEDGRLCTAIDKKRAKDFFVQRYMTRRVVERVLYKQGRTTKTALENDQLGSIYDETAGFSLFSTLTLSPPLNPELVNYRICLNNMVRKHFTDRWFGDRFKDEIEPEILKNIEKNNFKRP